VVAHFRKTLADHSAQPRYSEPGVGYRLEL